MGGFYARLYYEIDILRPIAHGTIPARIESREKHSESVTYDGANTKVSTQAKTDDKTCQNCPPEGKVMPMVRRCSRWSAVTISYQTRICGTFYNPETKQIQEFKYSGVSFDGWKDKLCQFWEAKARYDQFLGKMGLKKNGGGEMEAQSDRRLVIKQ